MRLELASFPVKEVAFGNRTRYEGGALGISRDELEKLVLTDPRISRAKFHIVTPGEKTRIVRVRDAVEPRVKVKGEGTVFPGILGPPTLVGSGTTNRLSNFAVITAVDDLYAGGPRPPHSGGISDEVLDMSGPGALSPVSQQSNLVLEFELSPGYPPENLQSAVQLAELKVADHLAKTTVGPTVGLKPQEVEVFELTPTEKGLPSVVYICCWWHNGASYYGLPLDTTLPIWVHPNEILDGAMVTTITISGGRKTTLAWQNHPGVLELYKHHGKDFNYKGLIYQRMGSSTTDGQARNAYQAAKLAQLMGADTAIVTWMGASGRAMVETMTTVQTCEKLGIKTAPIVVEYNNQSGTEPPVVFMVPEAVSVVSGGHNCRYTAEGPLRLAPMDKVIGGKDIALDATPGHPRIPTNGEIPLVRLVGFVFDFVDIWGGTTRTTREF